MSSLRIENLQKKFGNKVAVRDVSFEINSSEIVGLLGPNGAGKTTSFYMVLGLVVSNKGRVFLDGLDITRKKIHQRANLGLGYLPQESSIFRKLTVFENLLAILELKNKSKKECKKTALNLMEEFRVSHLKDTLGISLSGGERRRVEIARALASDPKFILLDEPFAGIDPISIIDLQKIIVHLSKRGVGVLITDHNVRETLSICHRAYIINDGVVMTSGNAQEIFDNKAVRETYLGNEFNF